MLAKLRSARATLSEMERLPGTNIAAVAWQRGYAKAVEEMLDVHGVSLRRHPRQPTSITTDVRRLDDVASGSGRAATGTIIDLSRSGCGLTTWLRLSVGDWIEVALTPPEQRASLRREGRVRRVQQMGDKLRAGVEFAEELPSRP